MAHQLLLKLTDYEDFVEVLADGQDLGSLVDQAIEVAAPGQAFGDDSIPWRLVDSHPPLTVFDEEVLKRGARSAILFVCGCGEWGCANVAARVTITSDQIILSHFKGHRVCLIDYGPFEFDRGQFLAEVRQFKARIRAG